MQSKRFPDRKVETGSGAAQLSSMRGSKFQPSIAMLCELAGCSYIGCWRSSLSVQHRLTDMEGTVVVVNDDLKWLHPLHGQGADI